jgi:hypothetical protein
MNQHGSTGQEVDRDAWWSSTDIDYAYIAPADAVEVLEVLEQVEPFWADAMLTADQAGEILAGLPEVATRVAEWAAAGLVLARISSGLGIYSSAPERRPVGSVYRRYNDTWFYEAVRDVEQSWRNRRIQEYPPIRSPRPGSKR